MQEKLINKLRKNIQECKPTILLGTPGTGKSYCITAACNQENAHPIYLDGSCKKSIKYIQSLLADDNGERLKKTVVVFDSFDSFVEDGLSMNGLFDMLKRYKMPLFFSANPNMESKMRKVCRLEGVVYILMNEHNPTKTEVFEHLKLYVKENSIKVTQKKMRQLMQDHLPDMRKMLISLNGDVSSQGDYNCGNVYQHAKSILNHPNIDETLKTASYDIFMIPAIMHENSIKLGDPKKQSTLADAFSSGDVFHTYMYRTQSWDLIETYCALSVLYPSRQCKSPESDETIHYSTYMNKLSNISVRKSTIQRLCTALNKNSVEQLYVVYLGAKKKRGSISKQHLMALKRFFET